jgi:hypothetical protein
MLALAVNSLHCEPIILDHADIMRTTTFAGKSYRELEGDVQIRWGSVHLSCELARLNQDAGTLHAVHDVQVLDGDKRMSAEQINIDDPNQRMEARSKVHFVSDTLEAWCEKAIWSDGLKQGHLQLNARVFDRVQEVQLKAGQIFIDNTEGFVRATRAPQLDFLGERSGHLQAKTLIWMSDSLRATAIHSVLFENEDFLATCDSLIWDDQQHWIQLFQDPNLQSEDRELQGRFIHVAFDSLRALDSLIVRGAAQMLSPASSVSIDLFDALQGDSLDLSFQAGSLSEVLVRGDGMSVFFIRDKAGKAGMNVARAPQMSFHMDSTGLESIQMQGGVKAFWLGLDEPEQAAPVVPDEEKSGMKEDEE